ncbi:MAG: hypothetical protein PHT07_06275 [Paludibacter sp.]|nr:hypothetical protein [Paludibacter sp.]
MRKLYCFFLLIINISVFGQKITFSSEILNSTDKDVKEIAALWKNYFELYASKNDTSIMHYWNEEERKSKFIDIIKYALSPELPIYRMGNHVTFDIRKLNDEFYEIFTKFRFENDSDKNNILMIYRICAKKENGEYKFYNAFYCNKQFLKSFSLGNINYYYPFSYPMDNKIIRRDAKKTKATYENIQNYYHIKTNSPITFIFANSNDECNAILGIPYTKLRSHFKSAGNIFSRTPCILLSCKPDHLHELTHSLFIPLYPNAPFLFQEGIATYYGGSGSRNLTENIELLKKYVLENPNVNLADFDSYYTLLKDGSNPFYTVGAIFIDYAIKIGGAQKVLALFKYPSTNSGIYSAINTELGIEKDKINSFLKDYIKNYK